MEPYYSDKYTTIYHGDCREVLSDLSGFSAVVTDPPYELGFMGKSWDSRGVSFSPATWGVVKSSCSPGAPILAFGGTRTFHRIAVAIEDAGWELRDTLMWVYGCLSEDTEVLTKRGYMPYHKLTNCDIIRVYDIKNDIYSWEIPQRWQSYRVHKDTAYRIKSDNTDQLVSRNHNCVVEREGKLVFVKAENLGNMETMPILPSDISIPVERQRNVLFQAVQWDDSWSGMETTRPQRSCVLDRTERDFIQGEDEWAEQSSLEGWSDLFQNTRKLQRCEICQMPKRIPINGSQRWICNGASFIGRSTNRQTISEKRNSTSREPQSSRQQPNNVSVCEQSRPQIIRGRASYKTTLARISKEQYSGVIFCPTVSTGAFVARRNGKVFITGNSGFPKSLDISKSIDKQFGAERVVVGKKDGTYADIRRDEITGQDSLHGGEAAKQRPRIEVNITAPSTPEAKLWNGYGTALKPAYEPIILGMNPLNGTFANNALKEGVAGLNIDGCRITLNGEDNPTGSAKRVFAGNQYNEDKNYGDNTTTPDSGRFPANFLHDGSQMVMELFPNTGKGNNGKPYSYAGREYHNKETSMFNGDKPQAPSNFNDSGSASRFFYCAKASRSERDNGLDDIEEENVDYGNRMGQNNSPIRPDGSERKPNIQKNNHPTVKPLALMEYLCKLVKMPQYNLILDPFMGSGTTLLACTRLGVKSIGIDTDEHSCEIAASRCTAEAVARMQRGEY